jgi:hypothetical protein
MRGDFLGSGDHQRSSQLLGGLSFLHSRFYKLHLMSQWFFRAFLNFVGTVL